MNISLEIDNTAAWEAIQKLPAKVQNQILTRALRAGAKDVLPTAKQLAPKDTGTLRKSLKVRVLRATRKGVKKLDVTTNKSNNLYTGKTFYGAFQEFGWKSGKRGKSNSRRPIAGKHFLEQAHALKGPLALKTIEIELATWINNYKGTL